MSGWIPLHRSMFDRDDFLAPDKRSPACPGFAWLYLVALAQHKPRQHGGVRLERGEFLTSVRTLADRFGWSKSRTSRFMLRLASETMIGTVRKTPRGTVYRIVNYDTYAGPAAPERDTERDTERDRCGTRAGHERDKNNKEQGTSTTTAGREVFGSLDDIAVRAIVGLYGWSGREGTDERIWGDAIGDYEFRARCLTIAVQRLEGEGRAYQGRFFRRILVDVIAEQASAPDDDAPEDDHDPLGLLG